MKSELLEAVRKALRINSSKLYDDELNIYIDAVLDDLERHHIDLDGADDRLLARVKDLCVMRAKSRFGNSGPDVKQIWGNMYDMAFRKVAMDARLKDRY